MSNRSCSIYFLDSSDPFYNLAVEDYLLRNVEIPILLLYVNAPSVIIGHFQNPWQECNFTLMAQQGVSLVRRQSGGGAVYHYQQNLNYSFIAREEDFNLDQNLTLIKDVMKKIGVEVYNDNFYSFFISGYKFSGAAFKNIKGAKLHHGTLLLEGDSDFIHQLLTANCQIEQSIATTSKRSLVRSLNDWSVDISVEELAENLAQSFSCLYKQKFNGFDKLHINQTYVEEMAKQFRTVKWLYGKTPKTIFILPSGDRVQVEKGIITQFNNENCYLPLESFQRRSKKALSSDRALYRKIDRSIDYFLLR